MLLAVGIIAASAFIQNHECWGQVRTTEQEQRGQKAFPHQLWNTESALEVPGPRAWTLHQGGRGGKPEQDANVSIL